MHYPESIDQSKTFSIAMRQVVEDTFKFLLRDGLNLRTSGFTLVTYTSLGSDGLVQLSIQLLPDFRPSNNALANRSI